VTAVAVDATSKFLASASKTITIWDLESRDKLKTLTGHSTDIFRLLFSLSTPGMFISAACSDRVLNLWSASGSNSALASFTANDAPAQVDLTTVQGETESRSLLCAVTSKGHLFIYDQVLAERKLKKPVKAVHQVVLETREGVPLPILAAFVVNEGGERLETFGGESGLAVFMVYGSHVNPVFEKLVRCLGQCWLTIFKELEIC